jgi:hypothetical protein
MSTAAERRFLKRLLESNARGVAESDVPKTCMPLLTTLEGCDCVRRIQGVRGATYVVRDRAVLAEYISKADPLDIDGQTERPTSRADAVLRFGNAKAALSADCLGVFVRTTKPDMTLTSEFGAICVGDLTRVAGGAAVVLREGVEWRFSGKTVALVENAEAFWHHERALPNVDLAVWTVGRMSARRLLAWLASPSMSHCDYIHWGDYDPVGVAEYIRLLKACPGRVSMWIPDDLDALVKRHGKRSLLLKRGNARIYGRLRAFTDDATVARFVQLFDTHGLGLEQEICLNAKSLTYTDAKAEATDTDRE